MTAVEKALSVCVAIYNIKEEILRECIESLIRDKAENAEIILGDDCSDNGADKICLEYAKKDSRIKYIRPEKNGGVSALRNKMTDAAKGKLITFVDGDDVVSENYIKRISAAADGDWDIVMFGIRGFVRELPPSDDISDGVRTIPNNACMQFSRACLTGEPPHAEDFGIKESTPSSVCIKAYRREFLKENNIRFAENVEKSQDTVFNTKAFFCCRSLGYIPDILYFYRKNPDSICNRYSKNFDKIMSACFECDNKNLNELFGGNTEVRDALYRYKIILIIIDNFKLNIFHRDNPGNKYKRKSEFLEFVGSEPYKSFFENFDFDSYEWRERKLILKLAKNKNFGMLDFMYKYPITFKAYGWIKNKLSGAVR